MFRGVTKALSMKFTKILVASAALLAAIGAQAQVTGTAGGGYGSFLTLSSSGLSDGVDSVATLAGGSVYSANVPGAVMPTGTVGSYLAAGPTAGTTANLSFGDGGVSYISFLWGSPDSYNKLTVTTTGGVETVFSASGLGLATGPNVPSKYVQFTADAGLDITGLSFTNVPAINAFESSNYSITPVPEPETYALMLAGLGVMGFVARRRRAV
jgi:PEP-CTERM motif